MADDPKLHRDERNELIRLRAHVQELERERDELLRAAAQGMSVENQVKSSQAVLQRIVQQIPIGIQVFDPSGLCTDVNDAHLDIFGVERDDLVGKYNIFDDPLANEMLTGDAARRALAGEIVHLGDLEFTFSHGDARYTDIQKPNGVVNVTLFPIFDHEQNVSSFVGLNMDVTERKQIENQLRMSKERYQAVVEDQPSMICRFLPDGAITFVNNAYCEFQGRSRDELIGTQWQTLISEKNFEEIKANVESLSHENPSNYAEYEMIDPEGKLQWIHWINRAFFDENDQVIEYQGTGIYITEKKLFEQQQFQIALERERTKILSQFVVRAAHEFRTPLSIINSSAYAMTRMNDPENREERLKKITKQVDRISRLLDSMILMSRLDSDVSHDDNHLSNLNQLLEIAFFRFTTAFDKHGIRGSLNLSEHALIVDIKQKDFVRAIEAILENALKYTELNDEIHIQSHEENDYAVVTISDTGKGIDSETLPHIFERFYSQDQSGRTPGLGLGLPIAKALLGQFGASIDVSSESGHGSTFIIKLKLANAMQA